MHVDEFCRKQLEPYAGAFPKGGEVRGLDSLRLAKGGAQNQHLRLWSQTLVSFILGRQALTVSPCPVQWSSLEHVERRFAWFRRSLKQVDDRFDAVFPPTWRVQHCLLMAFLQQTRQHILEILEGKVESHPYTH